MDSSELINEPHPNKFKESKSCKHRIIACFPVFLFIGINAISYGVGYAMATLYSTRSGSYSV